MQVGSEGCRHQSGVVGEINQENQLDPSLAEHPERGAAPRMDAADEVRCEVLLGIQRDAKIADEEELDEHEAVNARRIRKASVSGMAGRPRKMTSELIADCASMIRDRVTHVNEQATKITDQWEPLVSNWKLALKELPKDVEAVRESSNKEVK